MCLITFYDESNPFINAVKLMVSRVLMFHENVEIIPSVDYYDLYPCNYDPTEHITLLLVGIPVINQPDFVEVVK